MGVTESRAAFLAIQKRWTEAAAKKVKLEARQAELREKLETLENECVENQAERSRLTESFALGEISSKQYDASIKNIVMSELDRAQCAELVEAVNQCLVDSEGTLAILQRELSEAERKFFAAIAETLAEDIKTKIPAKDLSMLAFARLRSGRVQGVDAWRNMLIDVCGSGRFSDEDLKITAQDISKLFGL